jgi:hypothetical protein
MKFYETTTEEYISAVDNYNFHSEWKREHFPATLRTFENMIIYGPTGSGKYTQVLKIIRNYSPSDLKYEKKMTVQSEKQSYCFHLSDIHYEIDMAFLGCNSKTLWHDIFYQIVDIISVKPEKTGIIICKNFHMIHSELLEIFYSYMQKIPPATIIKYIIMTEHISFIPNTILNSCAIIPIKKPRKPELLEMIRKNAKGYKDKLTFQKRLAGKSCSIENVREILNMVDSSQILNLKEVQSFSLVKSPEELPTDIFNIICDQIIEEVENIDSIPFTKFRDSLYDIMIYNLDVVECIWYILVFFIKADKLSAKDISDIIEKTYSFLQYYNNNYRPIYHLENMMFYIIKKLKGYDDRNGGKESSQHSRNNRRGSQKGISTGCVEISSR